jgi:hypothetical protein
VEYETLPKSHNGDNGFLYMVEVYVDDFMSLVIPVSWEQLQHVAAAIMTGIHDVFPPDANNSNDPISEKKLWAQKGLYSMHKTLLGFDFNGTAKTMWLEAAKQEKLLTILKGWIWTEWRGMAEFSLPSLSLQWQNFAMHSRAFQQVWACCHRVIGSSKHGRSIFMKITGYSLL